MLKVPNGTEGLVERTEIRIRPDPTRVVSQLFVAGEEVVTGASRATTVMRRVLALTEAEVDTELAGVVARFEDRHEDLAGDLVAHYNQISDRVGETHDLSVRRRMLLGAYATSEYAVESVSLCNPSIVSHPDQTGVTSGHLRFVLSLRAIGEGHMSSIEFRTGMLDADGGITIEDPGRFAGAGKVEPGPYVRAVFAACLEGPGSDLEVASSILDRLPSSFTGAELEASIAHLRSRALSRGSGRQMVDRIRNVAESNYTVAFAEGSRLAQRVLRPVGPNESRGMEDARFVRFVDDDASVTYYGVYTAFDGARISLQRLATDDFRTFTVSQLAGRAATNKGMALFPRRIGGRYFALSRWDRESNAVTSSTDARNWIDATEIHTPAHPWELVQVGNCGSPMETPEGWLVITHGVGPMRRYCLGAILLDLDDPCVVRGRLSMPLLEPDSTERDGYVPNVVYSCGALIHAGKVILPYAHGDSETTFARVSLSGLLGQLLAA